MEWELVEVETGWLLVYQMLSKAYNRTLNKNLKVRLIYSNHIEYYELRFVYCPGGGLVKFRINDILQGWISYNSFYNYSQMGEFRVTPFLRRKLDDFKKFPILKLCEYGLRKKRCSFCWLKLKSELSIVHGYGRRCAHNFGLPWSKRFVLELKQKKYKIKCLKNFCHNTGVCDDIIYNIVSYV